MPELSTPRSIAEWIARLRDDNHLTFDERDQLSDLLETFALSERVLLPKLPQKTVRGLQWIHSQAGADYAACADEKGTGQFAGTSSKEVDEALDWLNGFIQGNVR